MKFTPQAIEKIKDWVVQGVSREEIANLLGATVGSLQVTCSRLGISLRRKIGSPPRTLDPGGRIIPTPGVVGIAHVQGQKTEEVTADTAPLAKFAITIRGRDKEVTSDVTLTSPAIGTLALVAMSRDLGIAELIGEVLVAALKKDMIEEILT